jgi:hypothetical protein
MYFSVKLLAVHVFSCLDNGQLRVDMSFVSLVPRISLAQSKILVKV